MSKRSRVVIGATLFLALFFIDVNAHALSPETELLLKLLEKKEVVTRAEADGLRREVEAPAPQAVDKETIKEEIKEELKTEGGLLSKIQEHIQFSGLIEFGGAWQDVEYTDGPSEDESDFACIRRYVSAGGCFGSRGVSLVDGTRHRDQRRSIANRSATMAEGGV